MYKLFEAGTLSPHNKQKHRKSTRWLRQHARVFRCFGSYEVKGN